MVDSRIEDHIAEGTSVDLARTKSTKNMHRFDTDWEFDVSTAYVHQRVFSFVPDAVRIEVSTSSLSAVDAATVVEMFLEKSTKNTHRFYSSPQGDITTLYVKKRCFSAIPVRIWVRATPIKVTG